MRLEVYDGSQFEILKFNLYFCLQSRGIVEYSVMGTTCDLLQGTSDHELVKK